MTYLGVAQLVARVPWEHQAVGSSPTTQTLWAKPTGKDVFPMDKIVRIRECDVCGLPVMEEYRGNGESILPNSFKVKMSSIVFVPPEGRGRTWKLCEQCANAVCEAIDKCVTIHEASKAVS